MYRTRIPVSPQAAQVSRYRPPDVHVREAAARSFYRDLLGGREVWPTDHGDEAESLWFLVEEQLVEVGEARAEGSEILELRVASPVRLAERCWDGGYTVRLDGTDADRSIRVTDPYGRSITLVPRARSRSASEVAVVTTE